MTSERGVVAASSARRFPVRRFLASGVGGAALVGVGLFVGAGTASATPDAEVTNTPIWGYLQDAGGASDRPTTLVTVDYRRACGLICNGAAGTALIGAELAQ